MENGGCGQFRLRCIRGLMLLCILCVGITVSVSAIDEFAGGGGQSPGLAVITPKTITASCIAPCECMMASDADARWGSGNYISCSKTPCGEVVVNAELRVPKFCYRMQSQAVIVTTTTPVPGQVQPPLQVIPAKQVIPVQPGSQDIVRARNIQQKGVVPAQVNPQNPLPPDDQGPGKDSSGLSAGSLGKTGSVQPGFVDSILGFFTNLLSLSDVNRANNVCTDECADLAITSADPVQVVYGGGLVKDKGTAFRVKVTNSAIYPITTKFHLILPDDQWDMVRGNALHKNLVPSEYKFPEIWGPVEIPPGRDFEVMLPYIPDSKRMDTITFAPGVSIPQGTVYAGKKLFDNTVDAADIVPTVRAMPKPTGSRVHFSVIINPDGTVITPGGVTVPETDLKNNEFTSPDYDVLATDTQALGVQRMAVTQPKISGNTFTPYCNPATSPEEGRNTFIQELEYALAVYPVADDNIYGRYAFPDDSYNLAGGRGKVFTKGFNKIQGTEYNYYVMQECGSFAQSSANSEETSLVIGNQSGRINDLAHEMGHRNYGGMAPDCYYNNVCACPQCSCVNSEGFWVNNWEAVTGGNCTFMGPVGTAPAVWARLDRIGGPGMDFDGNLQNGYSDPQLADGSYNNIRHRWGHYIR